MKRPRELKKDIKVLSKYEKAILVENYLKENFGLEARVKPFMNYIDIHLKEKVDNIKPGKLVKDKVTEYLKDFYNSLDKGDSKSLAEAAWLTEYGYTIVLDSDKAPEEKLLEESTLMYHYHGDEEQKEDQEINRFPKKKKETPKVLFLEATTTTDDLDDASNIVLDKRFHWYFTILDQDENELEANIDNLDDAIDYLIDLEGKLIIALPYIDPKPSDDNVDLVFADNPGVVIVYDGR